MSRAALVRRLQTYLEINVSIDYDGVVSICDAHGICLPVDCIEMVVEIVRHAALASKAAAVEVGEPLTLTHTQIEAITCEEYAKRQGNESDFDCILKVVKRCLGVNSEPRNVEGMTRDEFEAHLRVCYQHDNVRAHINAPDFRLTEDQERAISERVELNYPKVIECPGCMAWDSGLAEVNFVQGCEGCRARMRKANGVYATPPAPIASDSDAVPVLDEAAAIAGPAMPPIVRDVLKEIERAVAKFPTWPTDPLHAFAVLGEEVGELQKAILQCTYEPHKSTRDDVRTEAIQAAAMALRFLLSLDCYEYWRAVQHEQEQS